MSFLLSFSGVFFLLYFDIYGIEFKYKFMFGIIVDSRQY